MANGTVKAVIFDIDGTLMDTAIDVAVCVNRTLEKNGLPPVPVEQVGPALGGSIYEVFDHFLPEDVSTEFREKIIREYLPDYGRNFAVETVPFEGAYELLVSLKNAGIRLGVISNKTEDATQEMMRRYFPDTVFDFVWGNTDRFPLKPAPDLGFAAIEKLGLPPSSILYVGDSDTDILFADRCGFLSVGAAWGYRGREELEKAGAKYIADSLMDIMKIPEIK